jgi:drug/metabolite transporter (DMT)-like permease
VGPRRRIYLQLSLVVLLWSGAFVGIKVLLEHVSIWTIAFLRFALTTAGLALAMAVLRPRTHRIERAHVPWFLLLGLTGVSAYHLSLNFGERYISANVAALIVASMPVMTAILARTFLGEEISPTKWGGIALAVAGVVVLVLWGTPEADLTVRSAGGAAVTALAPLSWAVYTIVSKRLVHVYGPLPLATYALGLGTLMLAPFAIGPTLSDLPNLTPSDWAWIAFLGLGCSALAYVLWFGALEALDASSVAAWVYLVPLLGQVWAAVVLGEEVTVFLAVGGAMVLAGVIVIERVAPKASTPTSAPSTSAPSGSAPSDGGPAPQ